MSEQPLGAGTEINSSRFEYSSENPPPLDILESKIFAVHSTPILPKNGLMIAGARNTSGKTTWDDEPAALRPTIHFSLGEMVQKHGDDSWENNKYAVVTPLKSLKRQLLNLSPSDTFILGNFQLTPDSLLLVPRGTDTSDIPENIQVVDYNPMIDIRMAVDQIIRDKDGWPIRMQPGSVEIGEEALIDQTDINSADFFRSVFEEMPYVSYGTHATAERGEACRFGAIDSAMRVMMQGYSEFGRTRSATELQFYNAFAEHNLAKLDNFLHNQQLPDESLKVYEEKENKLRDWLQIVDIDLDIRKKYGKTLNRAGKEAHNQVRQRRSDKDKLQSYIESIVNELPKAPPDQALEAANIAAFAGAMGPDELKEFMQQNHEIFTKVTDLPTFYAVYALSRWLNIKTEQARVEGLGDILQNALPQLDRDKFDKEGEPVFIVLKQNLSTNSNRLSTALEILQQPYIKEYLQKTIGMVFEKGQPTTLEEVIRVHPETAVLFDSTENNATEEQQEKYDFLKKIGSYGTTESSIKRPFPSFRDALYNALEVRVYGQSLQAELQAMTQPMNTKKDRAEMIIGESMGLYGLLKENNPNAVAIWEKLGLAREYLKYFPNDLLFWNSSMSLLEIYKLLQKEKNAES